MKINKQFLSSIFWMVLIATIPLITIQLEQGKAIWELDWKALSSGIILVVLRAAMNYKNPKDTRYGEGHKDEENK